MTKAVATDQREHARLTPTVLRADVELEGERAEGYLMNLSLGGAFLALSDPPPPESTVAVRLLLPWGLGECVVTAQCVWEQRDADGRAIGAGVRFKDVPEDVAAKLGGYLERYQALAAEITE